MKLTIYHDGQFWVGVFEETFQSKLKACRYVFGREPLDEEVLEVVNREMLRLIQKTSQFVAVEDSVEKRINPKRLARLAVEEMSRTGISTKAQAALQLEREKPKQEIQKMTRRQREESQQRKWELKKEKAREKHKGH